MDGSRKSGGIFKDRKCHNLIEMTAPDFNNPWNFFSLMMLRDDKVNEWFRMHCNVNIKKLMLVHKLNETLNKQDMLKALKFKVRNNVMTV